LIYILQALSICPALVFFYTRFAKKKAPIYFLAPKKQKMMQSNFLERISEKYLVTFGNFCNFAAHLAKCPNDPINGKL